MQAVISVYKPISYTPNQIIKEIRRKFPHFDHEKIGFAGRLDPMAHGLLLLLVGDANFEREKYLNLDKTYQFTAFFGIETDSYDLLGLLKNNNIQNIPSNFQQIIDTFIQDSIGKQNQPYPPFSTKPVNGKELFKWAREGKINEIKIPTKEVTIYSFKQIKESTLSLIELKKIINDRISKVEGFFRQEEILKKWNNFFQQQDEHTTLKTMTFEVSCTSGTYVRSLVHNIGKKIGSGAVTLDIYRTQVGNFHLKDAIQLNL